MDDYHVKNDPFIVFSSLSNHVNNSPCCLKKNTVNCHVYYTFQDHLQSDVTITQRIELQAAMFDCELNMSNIC